MSPGRLRMLRQFVCQSTCINSNPRSHFFIAHHLCDQVFLSASLLCSIVKSASCHSGSIAFVFLSEPKLSTVSYLQISCSPRILVCFCNDQGHRSTQLVWRGLAHSESFHQSSSLLTCIPHFHVSLKFGGGDLRRVKARSIRHHGASRQQRVWVAVV
uniref:Uncharacterized protein n=1 Tax=Physcomitrium patens TaxID=3218 RepID=A0A2K1J9V8_PHYPA|nr:hypothetical protein PHYPA_021422 [Physcomitrium patens]